MNRHRYACTEAGAKKPNMKTTPFYRNAYFIGLALCACSFGLYFITKRSGDEFFGFFGLSFFVSYAMAIGYLLLIWIGKLTLPKPRPAIPVALWTNLVVLFTISAFSLNKNMLVFAPFPTWLNVVTVSMVFLFFAFPFIDRMNGALKVLIYLLAGSMFVFSLYMFIFLIPLMPLSIIGLIFFAISVHTFVPGAWLWLITDFMIRRGGKTKLKHFVWPGAAIPVIILAIYLGTWSGINRKINDLLSEKHLQLSHQLPDRIYLAQKLPSDPITEEILMSGFRSQRFFGEGMSGFNLNGIGDEKFHDPLALIGIGLYGAPDIDAETAQAILDIRKDYRHRTGRRLWSGSSLSTASVSNNIEVFPEYRMAYQEKTIVVHNDPEKSERSWFWSTTEEAIYTFHVPEGSIVTSLSLWINGREMKSRLTTGQKADSAYTTIVGVEQRDPATVKWQEGNTLRVCIFPCTTTENRTFKIGFTTPLAYRNGSLWLDNVWFEGPGFEETSEATRILFNGKPVKVTNLPEGFEQDAKGDYTYKGDYTPSWSVGLEQTAVSANHFSFGGYEYHLEKMATRSKPMQVKNVYLDITSEWTKEEYEAILDGCKDKNIFAWLPEQVEVAEANKDKVWDAVSENQFSVPFLYSIMDPENSIVITKTGSTSPLLTEMSESDYADKMGRYLSDSIEKVTVLNIGTELSPLWRSLHELRVIDYMQGTPEEVLQMIRRNSIVVSQEDSMRVALNESGLSIVKRKSESMEKGGKAPDHLLRLFAYNDLLRKIGRKYFEKEKYEDELFREAEEGYVVSPISSMIVLETENDYQRMGIKENENTVGNAGIIGGGAVPEPHEWALIALVASFILWKLYIRKKKANAGY
jgi:XrtN system VIT domain protein